MNTAPNSEVTAFHFRLLMIQTAINHGKCYAEIERDRAGRPVALWPLPNRMVDPIRDDNGNLKYRVLAGSLEAGGQDVILNPTDVFHIRNLHTKDGITGQGLIAYASETLGISLAADRMASSLFKNGGLPTGVLAVEGTLSADAQKRLEQSWKDTHSGNSAGGVAVLEQGAKYT